MLRTLEMYNVWTKILQRGNDSFYIVSWLCILSLLIFLSDLKFKSKLDLTKEQSASFLQSDSQIKSPYQYNDRNNIENGPVPQPDTEENLQFNLDKNCWTVESEDEDRLQTFSLRA